MQAHKPYLHFELEEDSAGIQVMIVTMVVSSLYIKLVNTQITIKKHIKSVI